MTPSQNADELVTEPLCFGDVYEEYAIIKIFVEALDTSVRHSMSEYWGIKKNANKHDRTFHSTFLPR